jgi:hypothetical protein
MSQPIGSIRRAEEPALSSRVSQMAFDARQLVVSSALTVGIDMMSDVDGNTRLCLPQLIFNLTPIVAAGHKAGTVRAGMN